MVSDSEEAKPTAEFATRGQVSAHVQLGDPGSIHADLEMRGGRLTRTRTCEDSEAIWNKANLRKAELAIGKLGAGAGCQAWRA